MTERNLTENSNGKQEQIDDNVVVQQIDIAEAMNEDPLFKLKVINKALSRENKKLKEQIRIMGEAGVNKAKEKKMPKVGKKKFPYTKKGKAAAKKAAKRTGKRMKRGY